MTSHGTERPCVKKGGAGTCTGVETCDKASGWSACSARDPAAEECNGVDDDCNGVADDGISPPEGGDLCPCGGVRVCKGADGWQCVGLEPKAETCNYQDDDCDDQTDEDFKGGDGLYSTPAHCGGCGRSCEGRVPFAKTVACDAVQDPPACVVTECMDGYYRLGDVSCVPQISNLCSPCAEDANCGAAGNLCLDLAGGRFCGRDCAEGSLFGTACPTGYACTDVAGKGQCLPATGSCDCTGANAGLERACAATGAAGTCFGIETCDAVAGWTGCTAATPAAETCNGLDDDCDGIADDGIAPPAEACANTVPGVGSCVGSWVCKGQSGFACIAATPQAETCNYADDDCDGATDEGFTDAEGRYATVGHCGQCGSSCAGKVPFAASVVCDASGATPACRVTACLDGYVKSGDLLCLPQASNLCLPCADDVNCGSAGNKCLDLGVGRFCGRDCSQTSPSGQECPTGFSCKEIAGGSQCAPDSGSCDCNAANAGMHRICAKTSDSGTCYGTETCDPTQGWAGCTARMPVSETCNGVDDDCNGFVDDQLEPPATACANSWTDGGGTVHTCAGTWVCAPLPDGVDWVCPARHPGPESCNYTDDDCDGAVDEDFKLAGTDAFATVEHCGACGVGCTGLVPHATMACDASAGAPRCAVSACEEGFWRASDLSCLAFPDTQCKRCLSDSSCQVAGDSCLPFGGGTDLWCLWDCSPASAHPISADTGSRCPAGYSCREKDAAGKPFAKCVPDSGSCDCTPSNAGEERLCESSNDLGTCRGVETCDPGKGWVGCTAAPPSAETCNDADDDCDGLADEDFPGLGTICSAGQGACFSLGVTVCAPGGLGVTCSAVEGGKTDEKCNGIDDDCDGQTDEGFDLGAACQIGKGQCARGGVVACDGAGAAKCTAAPGPTAAEACNFLDDDCDGETDEGFDLGAACQVGKGQCARGGVVACDGAGAAQCTAAPGPTAAEACNFLDDDCDGETDEDFRTDGRYVAATACGNCFVDCTGVWTPAAHHATAFCDASGAQPKCDYACEPGYADPDTNPDNGCELLIDPDAVYVKTPVNGGSDAAGCGTLDHPCASVGYALARAKDGAKKRVLVSEGIYPENVTLTGGIDVLGGHSAATWGRDPKTNVTVLSGTTADPDANPHRKAVTADGITVKTEFSGFTIYGENTYWSKPGKRGGNSYAIWVRDSSGDLVVRDNVVFAGRGSPGAPGTAGAGGDTGIDGAPGANGHDTLLDTCVPGTTRAGGAGGASACGGAGGKGASSGCPHNNDMQPAGTAGTGTGAGAAGAGGADAYVPNNPCNQPVYASGATKFGGYGGRGASGVNGGAGAGGGNAAGAVDGGEWVGDAGVEGGAGTHGAGGGGGGAGGGVDANKNTSCTDTLGGAGGGGGGAGCGGGAGGGGNAGGGSFGVFVIRSGASAPPTLPAISGNFVVRNHAGDGGRGGDGGYGGAGGAGGAGGQLTGLYFDFAAGTGGFGGAGGKGGHGGGGGGGSGGASFAVFARLAGATVPGWCAGGTNSFGRVGGAGAGGLGGGSAGADGAAGAGGVEADCSVE
ncbi:MAG: hypothetical protein FJ087_13505 [Deltaproteobacteria bacterium]|nr:hypothetical protein [Deltaproteobacteria bacterium]